MLSTYTVLGILYFQVIIMCYTCTMRGLVLAGGGARGAYQAGVLKYLLHDLQLHFDFISGVSVGALNAAAIGQFSHGQEKEASNYLLDIWLDTRAVNVFKSNKFRDYIQNKSLYNTRPLADTIKKYLDTEKLLNSDKTIIVSATEHRTKVLREFYGSDRMILSAILASAAIPILFPPVYLEGRYYLDGGVREIVPVNTLKARGCTEIISIVPTPKHKAIKAPSRFPSFTELVTRSVNLVIGDINEDDLLDHLVIRPDNTLTENALDFSQDLIVDMIAQGYQDAKEQYHAYYTANPSQN